MFRAVLDTSGTIDDELIDVLLRLDARRGREPERDRHKSLVRQMKQYFPGATINAPRASAYSYDLKDPGDGHIAHAAIIGRASAIVTGDRKAGFESCSALADADIEILTAPEFAATTVAAHLDRSINALNEMASRRKNPPESPVKILELLRDLYDMHEVHNLLRLAL